jgi:hypothetical protein
MRKLLLPILFLVSACNAVSVQAEGDSQVEIPVQNYYIRYEYSKMESSSYILNEKNYYETSYTFKSVYYIDDVYLEETPDEWTLEVINNEPNWSLFTPEILFYKTKQISYQVEDLNVYVNINYSVVKLNNV